VHYQFVPKLIPPRQRGLTFTDAEGASNLCRPRGLRGANAASVGILWMTAKELDEERKKGKIRTDSEQYNAHVGRISFKIQIWWAP